MASLNVYALARLIEDHPYIVDRLLCYSFGLLHVSKLNVFDELYRQYIVRQVWDEYVMGFYEDHPVPALPQFPAVVSIEKPNDVWNRMMMDQAPTMEDFCVKLYDSVEKNKFGAYHSLYNTEKRERLFISYTPYFVEMQIGRFNVSNDIVKDFVPNPVNCIGRMDTLECDDEFVIDNLALRMCVKRV